MVQQRVPIDVCDRCPYGTAKPATAKHVVIIDGEACELVLCEPHDTMFNRDMYTWTRLGKEIDAPVRPHIRSVTFTEERKEEARRLTQLREKAHADAAMQSYVKQRLAQIDVAIETAEEKRERQSIPGALGWRLTTHAAERMQERGFTVREVLQAAAMPKTVVRQPWRGDHIAIHCYDNCRVVVDDVTKAIITVIDRNDTLETAPPIERKAL